MNSERIDECKLIESDQPDESHAVFIARADDAGTVSWWAGYGWERAGEINTVEEWEVYLAGFAKEMN